MEFHCFRNSRSVSAVILDSRTFTRGKLKNLCNSRAGLPQKADIGKKMRDLEKPNRQKLL